MSAPEILKGNNGLAESPEIKTEAVNYTTILKKLGLEEEQVTPDIITRLKEHFSLYTNGVEANLALLEEKLNLSELDEEKKIEALKEWMSSERKRITVTEEGEDTKRTVETTIENIKDIPDEVQGQIAEKINAKLSETPSLSLIQKIPFIGEWFTNGLIDSYKESRKETGFSIGKLFFGIIASWLGIEKLLDTPSNVAIPAKSEIETPGKIIPKEVIKPLEADVRGVSPEKISILSDEGKQGLYENAGRLFLLNISGMSFEKNNNQTIITNKLSKVRWENGQIWYIKYLEEKQKGNEETAYKELLSHIGEESKDFLSKKDKETVLAVFEGFFGGVSFNIIKGKITSENIEKLLNAGKIEKKFGSDYSQYIRNTPIESLTVKDVSIILSLLIPTSVLESSIEGINTLREYLFGENKGEEIEAFKREVQERKEGILDGRFAIIAATQGNEIYIRQEKDLDFKNLLLEKGQKIEDIEKLISFKNTFLQNVFSMEKYTLGYDGFAEKLSSHLNYKEIIAIYTFLDGNPDLSNLGPLESSGIYYWISKLLSQTNLDYVGELGAETLKENSPHLSDIEKAILERNLQRFLEQGAKIIFAHNKPIDAAARTVISEALENTGFEAKEGTITQIEWMIILGIMGGGITIMKIPHTLGKIIGFGVLTFGTQFGVYKLYEMGFFSKAKTALRPNEYELLNTQIQSITGKSITEIAEAEKKGVPVDELF